MKEQIAKATAQAFKEITLADIYEELAKGKERQQEDFRYLTQRIDSQVGQVRQEIGQINQRIDQINQKIDSQGSQLNQRLDTVIQMLVDVLKQQKS